MAGVVMAAVLACSSSRIGGLASDEERQKR